jgi:cell division protein FtsL
VSFYKLYTTDENYLMATSYAFDIYFSKLRMYNFSVTNQKQILQCSKFYEDKKQLKSFTQVEKFEYLTLVRFYDASLSFITNMANKYKQEIEYIELDNFIDQFKSINKDFQLTNDEMVKIFKKQFDVVDFEGTLKISLESFFTFFSKKLSVKISVDDYLNVSLKALIDLIGNIEASLKAMFQLHSIKGILYFTEFDAIFKKIFAKSENKWKTLEYFRY